MKKYIYSTICAVAATGLTFSACTPDEYEMGSAQVSAQDLTESNAYTVTVEGNKVILTSNLEGCTPLWITPQGRSQEKSLTLELPFAGNYEVTFGAITRAGAIYGEPYQFTLDKNDFSLLSDTKWFYLSDQNFKVGDALPSAETLSSGISKRWYPNDADYGLGCTGPVMYMTPYDPTNTGNYTDAEAANGTYKPVTFGRDNWAPNWDPGFQSWLIADTNPYMDSYMEFSMDASNGCVAKMYRGEEGEKGASTGSNLVGKFNLGLSDKEHPTISFDNCYAMHNIGFDEVCNNYTQDIIIADLTPYYLCLVTKRTNSEGAWYLVWNFVSEDVRNTHGACIPKADAGLLTTTDPVLPEFSNLADDLFKVESNGVTYTGNQITYTINADVAYDWMNWNGAQGSQKWESLTNGDYNDSWAPKPDDSAYDNELVLSMTSDGSMTFAYGETEGTFSIEKNTITFSQEITFLTATGDNRTVAVKGTTFTVLDFAATEGMTLGIPASANEKGNVSSYLVVNLTVKPIGAPVTGPVVVELTTDYVEHSWIENGCLRLGFHHYGDGGTGIFKDASSVKLKKDQTIKVTFKLKSGSGFANTPKCALIDNNIKQTWEPGCFDLEDAVTVNLEGETTVTLKNNTGATQKFTPTCLDLSIQMNGFYSEYVDGMDAPDLLESVTCVIE